LQDRVDKLVSVFNNRLEKDIEKAKPSINRIVEKEQLSNLVIKHVRSQTGQNYYFKTLSLDPGKLKPRKPAVFTRPTQKVVVTPDSLDVKESDRKPLSSERKLAST